MAKAKPSDKTKQQESRELAAAMEAYLAKGGTITRKERDGTTVKSKLVNGTLTVVSTEQAEKPKDA